ncbi:NifU family protein [Nisaea sp.]|uniref:NifU family protein n=1 Tax=Nisaea sp. TaxID=2024842 RepID=UPI0032EBEE4D
MFIQTEETPNPATLKFLPGQDVMGAGTAEYRSEGEAAGKSPLAERLFDVDGVTGVFFGSDFVTVTKRDDKEWYLMKPAVLGVVMEHFTAGRPVVTESSDSGHASDGEDSEVVSQIKELLDTRVRPAVAMDGGDIVFESFDEGVVTLFMRGACAGCPSSTATLKMGIENMLRHYIPEVREVRASAM